MKQLVTIATYWYPGDYLLMKSRLEAEGISCYMKDENIVTQDPLVTAAVGGIKLQVSEDDVDRAIQIMNEKALVVDEFQLTKESEDAKPEEGSVGNTNISTITAFIGIATVIIFIALMIWLKQYL